MMARQKLIRGYGLVLRPVTGGDLERVRRWRNAPHVRREMDFREHITPVMQAAWWRGLDPFRNFYWMIEVQGVEVGEVKGVEVGEVKGVEVGEGQGADVNEVQGVDAGEVQGADVGMGQRVDMGVGQGADVGMGQRVDMGVGQAVAVGVVHVKEIDWDASVAEAGIFIGKREYLNGFVPVLAVLGMMDAVFEEMGLKVLRAKVKAGQQMILDFNRRLGYEVVGEEGGFLRLEVRRERYFEVAGPLRVMAARVSGDLS